MPFLGARAAVQDWDPEARATGWASFDRDGSCIFLDKNTRRLLVWSRDTGVSDEINVEQTAGEPERWVMDVYGNVWVATGTTLQLVAKNGKINNNITLPAAVAELAWDAKSFILCYRTREPYLERRDLKNGSLMWSYGTKPAKGSTYLPIRHHVVMTEDGRVLLSSGASFTFLALDLNKGTLLDAIPFTLKGQPAPELNLGEGDRGALAWWMNNNIALAAVPASQLPNAGDLKGLILAKLNLKTRELMLLATNADEKAALIGILDGNAALRKPAGGLAFYPIP